MSTRPKTPPEPPYREVRTVSMSEVKQALAEVVDGAKHGIAYVLLKHNKDTAEVHRPGTHQILGHVWHYAQNAFESEKRQLTRLVQEGRVPKPIANGVSRLLEGLQQAMTYLGPDRVVATESGGVDVYFFGSVRDEHGSPDRTVTVGVDEEGDSFALFTDRVTGETRPVDLESPPSPERLRSLASEIEEFISAATTTRA